MPHKVNYQPPETKTCGNCTFSSPIYDDEKVGSGICACALNGFEVSKSNGENCPDWDESLDSYCNRKGII